MFEIAGSMELPDEVLRRAAGGTKEEDIEFLFDWATM